MIGPGRPTTPNGRPGSPREDDAVPDLRRRHLHPRFLRIPAGLTHPPSWDTMSDSLPGDEFWASIRPHTGTVHQVERTARGFSSDLTALVECDTGRFFVKAVANRPGGRRDSIIRERQINTAVVPISPALLWCTESDEWVVLGFAAVAGRTSDFTPGSGDLPAVVALLNRIGAVSLPEVAQDWTETRWDRFTGSEEEALLFRGRALLHTDIRRRILGRSMPGVDECGPQSAGRIRRRQCPHVPAVRRAQAGFLVRLHDSRR